MMRRIIGGRRQPRGNGVVDRSLEATFQRVVLLAPFWARWKELDAACASYMEVVGCLSNAPAGDQAWFIHDFEREAKDRRLYDKLEAAGGEAAHLYRLWHWLTDEARKAEVASSWTEVTAASVGAGCGVLADGLQQCAAGIVPEVAADSTKLLSDQLNLFSVRFFFDEAHFSRFLCDAGLGEQEGDQDLPAPYTVCIDLRFDVQADAYWTFATLSLWSDWPRHEHIAPKPPPGAEDDPELTLDELRTRRMAFEEVTERFECFLHGQKLVGGPPPADLDPSGRRGLGWSRPRLEVFDGAYRSPRFWFVVPSERPRSPLDYWADGEGPSCLLRPLADCFLELTDPRADSLAVAQLQGEYLVQRRFIHEHHGTPAVGDEPTYLLLPREGTARDQEAAGYKIARSLLELEWNAATVLFEVDSELEVARTHVHMYEAIARQAGVLLDALVLHLPGISGRRLRKAHDGIELVHQTLLQGIADLADMTTVVQAAVRKVGDGADELKARFDRKLDQQAVPDRPDIRVSLAERGLFNRLEEQARDDMALAERVQTRYQSLLQEITMAFEERRVREADKLERYSGTIALLFGIVGVVTALEASFDFRFELLPKGILRSVQIAVTGVAALLLVIIVIGLGRYRRVGKLGTRKFPRRYKAVWRFLASTSTDSLHELKAAIDQHPDDARRLWNEIDERFSCHLAELWDRHPPTTSRRWIRTRTPDGAPTGPSVRARRFGTREEIKRLTAQVESFVHRTMLISERSPRLNHFGLPRLTLLYRLLSATPSDMHTQSTPRLVSDFDVCASLGNAGYPPDHWETYLTWERELLDHERRSGHNLTAAALLEHIHATGICYGFSAKQADDTVRRFWSDIETWRTGRTSA